MTTIETRHAVALTNEGREFWRRALLAGAPLSLPRWTRVPVPGIGEFEAKLPGGLVETLRERFDELGVSFRSVLLAAHARVLADLSGEREVWTGYVTSLERAPLPCRLTTEPGSWRELVLEADRARYELLSHADFPIEDLRHEIGLPSPRLEILFDASVAGEELPDGAVLRVDFVERGECTLLLRFRTDAFDRESAGRIAGYHIAALSHIAADPDAEHARQSLLSREEMAFQLDGLAGPRRELPDRRVHELFEEQVRTRPFAVAAEHGDRRWTYAQLDTRANQVARALLSRGLPREGVVAVVTARNLEWMSAVLGIFKAGGAYLPIEPHFPPDRVAKMLARAGCWYALTERGSSSTLAAARQSRPGLHVIRIDDAMEWAPVDASTNGEPGIPVAADQLAYIYFTSGSTGEPKGVMCEHAGMLNHLLAKIHDLGIGPGVTVAQVAPQCFDISLWQLIAAPLVGGRTLLIEQEVILDASRFIETIVDGRVEVLQVVPSYLEVLVTYLEAHPQELPDLRFVSATGEALKRELVQRWFAIQPTIRLVNAYGLTETSDDTNHEILESAPEGERVPLGLPIHNAHVYIVDEYLSLVPLGAPGEIVFSGVCVGRGYVNDPERTQQAFLADPHRMGQRLYRSGDFGRWRPDGKLEFFGRRDAQVKVNGFRIEIGEIENSLLKLPGVRDGAVVVTGRASHTQRLVAFYSAEQPFESGAMRARLGSSLPDYMVPAVFHWRKSLPLTANGKIDRKCLSAIAGELEVVEPDSEAPATERERHVAAAWAQVLGIPHHRIGRRDHFFDLGGTSLSAVKLAIALERAVSIAELMERPVLAELAALIESRAAQAPERKTA